MIPEIYDMNPKTWLTPFQKNSLSYIFRMGLFYHGLGIILLYLGSSLAASTIPDYETPQFPVSILLAASAGLLEESIFFGIPYYMTGSPLVLVGTGAIWSVSHLFSADALSIQTLAFSSFLFTIPHIFFSIRTWISKKGWFAILFHSAWNVTFLLLYCMLGLRQCSIWNETSDILNMIIAIAAGDMLYLAYQNKNRCINRFLYLIPAAVILAVSIYMFSSGMIL